MESKLARPEVTPGTTARAKLRHLLARWKAEGHNGADIDPKKPPELVFVEGLRREVWKRINGEDYECIEVSAP
jgi:hypothetical protein